jgi:prefoldin subunit 5
MGASSLSDSITTMQCGLSLSLDDLLNVTSDNSSFFIGTNTLVTALENFNNSINHIISNFSALQANITLVQANCSSAQTALEVLSDGSSTNVSFSLNYIRPTYLSSSLVASSFGAILGVPSDNTTMRGAMYAIVASISDAMTTMTNIITTLSSTSSSIQSNIQSAGDSMANYSAIISGVDADLSITFNMIAPYVNGLRIAFLAYYGTVMGMSILAIVGVIMMACLNKLGCRHIMYGACVIILIITIFGFLLSFLLSFTIPILYMGCSVLNPVLSSSTNFLSNCF